MAKHRLACLFFSLEVDHFGPAAAVPERLNETLTLQRLGIRGRLYRELLNSNAIENLNS